MRTKHRKRKDKWFLIRYSQSEQNIFSFKIKRQAKNVFPRDVERTVGCHPCQQQMKNEPGEPSFGFDHAELINQGWTVTSSAAIDWIN